MKKKKKNQSEGFCLRNEMGSTVYIQCPNFKPVKLLTCSKPQNGRLNFSFVKEVRVDGKNVVKNGQKTAIYQSLSLPNLSMTIWSK